METNDIFDELCDINKLLRQTVFADKCLQLLDKYRHNLMVLLSNCKCGESLQNMININDLENEYKTIVSEKGTKSTEELNVNNNSNAVIDSADNDININAEKVVNFSIDSIIQNINKPFNALNTNNSNIKSNLNTVKPKRDYFKSKKTFDKQNVEKTDKKDNKNQFVFGKQEIDFTFNLFILKKTYK